MKLLPMLLAISSCVFAAEHSNRTTNLIKDEWEAFKLQYSKVYSNEVEESFRMKIYLENRQKIAKHNKDGTASYMLQMNKYGDLLPGEFRALLNGYRMNLRVSRNKEGNIVFLSPENFVAPKNVDWRTNGYVTPVKDQKKCGGCWAFSATGALEGQHMRKTGKLESLSEQNLIDCSSAEGNYGCDGGETVNAFQYVKKNRGIDTEVSYPYEAKNGTCRFTRDHVGADDNGFVYIPLGDEELLMNAVASVGPISIAVDASQESFLFYKSGVYYDEKCTTTYVDHAVLAVGYGTDNGHDYWLVKNSWGESWGEDGYIRMARNLNNACGVATDASYPVV